MPNALHRAPRMSSLDDVERSLATIEVAERVMHLVDHALCNMKGDDRLDVERTRAYCREMLDQATSQMTDTTCSLVKSTERSGRVLGVALPIARFMREVATEVADRVRL